MVVEDFPLSEEYKRFIDILREIKSLHSNLEIEDMADEMIRWSKTILSNFYLLLGEKATEKLLLYIIEELKSTRNLLYKGEYRRFYDKFTYIANCLSQLYDDIYILKNDLPDKLKKNVIIEISQNTDRSTSLDELLDSIRRVVEEAKFKLYHFPDPF